MYHCLTQPSQSVASVDAFFLSMALFPEAQKRAQAEIDRVIGTDRLPTFSDRDDLPYVNALVKEVMRWHSVAPTGDGLPTGTHQTLDVNPSIPAGVPHRVMTDDNYNGYFIPKGSLVIANLWSVFTLLRTHV